MTNNRHEIAFLLADLPDIHSLQAGLPEQIDSHLLDPTGDVLQQMADILSAHEGLDAIHLLSRSSDGALKLGDLTLTSDNMDEHSPVLQQIGASLNEAGDLMLYGCDLAQSETGMTFIVRLARITGARLWHFSAPQAVAAS